MTEALLNIKHWGNSLGVRLPAPIARAAKLRADQRVRVSVRDGTVIIAPADDAVSTLEQRLARFDPEKHGGEALPAERLGAERW